MMPLQNNVLSRGGPHPEGATAGPPPDATAAVKTVGQIPLDPLERFPGGGPARAIWGLLSVPPRGAGLGPLLVRREVQYGQVHEDGPGSSDPEEETGSETGY